MDFIFELPADTRGHTGVLAFVCRLSMMVRLVAVKKSVTASQAAQLFVDNVFRHHGLPEAFCAYSGIELSDPVKMIPKGTAVLLKGSFALRAAVSDLTKLLIEAINPLLQIMRSALETT
uniref:Integrase catalytic domain-containing protein n=1 Tax=Phytophthora ramorum TaxID=164328 RepID=H3H7E9_PHYRM